MVDTSDFIFLFRIFFSFSFFNINAKTYVFRQAFVSLYCYSSLNFVNKKT